MGTSLANLVPIWSGPVTTGLAISEEQSVQLNNMDQGQSRLGSSFTHFISISVGDDEEQTKGLEKLQNRLENVEGIGKKKNLKKGKKPKGKKGGKKRAVEQEKERKVKEAKNKK